MSKSWNRMETWLALAVLAAAAALTALLALPVYMSATSPPLHASAQEVPSRLDAAPAGPWLEAVARARQAVRAGLAAQNLPGLSVAVGAGGEIVWAEGFGWADLDTRSVVRPETRFRLGTASIPLTAAAVGVLLEQGRLRLDDEVRRYVPELAPPPWPLTVRQVMGHVAGVGTDGGDEGPLFGRHCDRPVDALREFAGRALLFEPGTRYRHSSYGWIVVSAAVEAAAGEPFLTFVRTQVLNPLGMDDTLPDTTTMKPAPGAATTPAAGQATPYFPRFAADPRYGVDPMRDIDLSCYAGASAFLSTPSDLVRFAMAIEAGRLLQPATVRMLRTPQPLADGHSTGYGLGWDLDTVTLSGAAVPMVGHDGDVLGGPVASLWTVPGRDLVVAVTSNVSYADTHGLAVKIADAFSERAAVPAVH